MPLSYFMPDKIKLFTYGGRILNYPFMLGAVHPCLRPKDVFKCDLTGAGYETCAQQCS